MKVLLIGDVVGRQGRKAVQEVVPQLRQEFGCSFCIANGENMAGGMGLNESSCVELMNHGVDAITSGDHVWDQREFISQIAALSFVLRPANLPAGQPGRGHSLFKLPNCAPICVVNLLGQIFMRLPADNPFVVVNRILDEVQAETKSIFVDIHAEATSEKIALGRFLDGRVTAVFGTHTHVPTADETVLPGGTAYLTDLGMAGAAESVLGRAVEPVVQRFSTGLPARFDVADGEMLVSGAIVTFDPETGRASEITRVARRVRPRPR